MKGTFVVAAIACIIVLHVAGVVNAVRLCSVNMGG